MENKIQFVTEELKLPGDVLAGLLSFPGGVVLSIEKQQDIFVLVIKRPKNKNER